MTPPVTTCRPSGATNSPGRAETLVYPPVAVAVAPAPASDACGVGAQPRNAIEPARSLPWPDGHAATTRPPFTARDAWSMPLTSSPDTFAHPAPSAAGAATPGDA